MAAKKTGVPLGKRKQIDFEIKVNGEDKSFSIREPQKEEVWLAMEHTLTTKPNPLKAGQSIFDTCCIEYDEEIKSDLPTYSAVCIMLCAEFASLNMADVKKK